MKRTLAFLCALALMLSLVPGAAFAATQDLQAEIDAGAETIVLEADASDITVTRDTTIDLNGHDISGVTVLGGTLYLQDSQTADYTVSDGVYGHVTNVTGNVKAAEGYLQVGDSFHAVNLDIYAMTLRASDVGVYYKSNFAADEIVAAEVESFGVALSVVTAPNASNLETYCGYSDFTGFEAGEGANSVGTSTLLKNIMKASNGDAKNGKNAAMPVYGRAYIKTSEGYFFGETVKRSLQEQVEAIDKVWNKLTDAQKTPVLAMLEGYTSVMENWNIPNIRGIQVPGADADIEIPIEVTAENGIVTEAVTVEQSGVSVTVPAGTKLAEGANGLTVIVTEKETSEAGLTLEESEVLMPMDVHVEGLAADNAAPLTIYLGKVMAENLNMGNYAVYHVENGKANEMILIPVDAEFTAHNQYKYSLDGELTLYMATFSEVAVVSEDPKWEGEFDYSWYDASKTELEIRNADQLAALSAIVGGMKKVTDRVDGKYTYSEEIIQDSFSGKTIKLLADIDLGDSEKENDPNKIFYPIGYYNSEGTYERTNTAITSGLRIFEGTFDGNGHTVSNFYHNTWEMKGDHNWYSPEEQYYRDGMGLFGRVYGGTIKNLTVRNFKSDGEIATTGVIAAYADGATFENIAIFDCNPRVYNIGNGGIVGCVGWYAKEANLKTTFSNITVDNSNKISALWGSYDVPCGGIVGQYYPTSGQTSANKPANGGIHMENCHVSAQLDVFNDVCANYQYYAYRYAGMLIGSVSENETIDGHVYPKMDKITAEGCTVHFGDWNDYYYCELVANSLASYTHDHQFSRLTQVASVDVENKQYVPLGETKAVAIPASGRVNYVVVNGEHATENATCYHFVDGAVWEHKDAGEETVDVNGDGVKETVLKEDNHHIYLEFNNLVTGYGWGVTTKAVGDLDGVTILDRVVADSVEKFGKADTAKNSYTTGATVTIGELFKATDAGSDEKTAIITENVMVAVSPVGETSTAGGTYTKAAADANVNVDWTQGTLAFSGIGAATITITDYYFCTPTTITVTINDKQPVEKFDVVMNNGDFLHRVGNNGTVPLDKLFKAKVGVTVGTPSVTVEAVDGTSASGTYSNNAIQFTGTGVVKVTITDNDYCIPTVLYLEVVNATNLTSATGTTTGGNFVLLQNINTSSYVNYWNCELYGNGFTYSLNGAPTAYNSKQGHGILILKNAVFDNVVIVGDVYDTYGAYTNNDNYNTAIDVPADGGNVIIRNSYIANCAAPVKTRGGNVTIIDTTLYGGTVANILISAGVVTLKNVTTVNYNDERKVAGLGIVIHPDATDEAKLVLEGTLKQYNFLNEKNKPDGLEPDQIHTTMFSSADCEKYLFGTSPDRYANTGIISMSSAFTMGDLTDNANTGYKDTQVSLGDKDGFVYTQLNTVGSVDNDYDYNADAHVAKAYGAIEPEYDFDYINKNNYPKEDGKNDYCYEADGVVNISMDEGDTFNWDTSILTATKVGNTLGYTVSMNGTDYTGKRIAFNVAGDYTVTYSYTDPYNYRLDENGNITTYSKDYQKSVNITVAVVEATTKHAEFKFGSSNTASKSVTIGNDTYVMPDVSATSSTIGSTTVSGQTIYYPIVEIIMSDSKTTHSSGWYAYFPVFAGAVTITDYKDEGNSDETEVYNGDTTTKPSNLSVEGDPATLFKYQSGSAAGSSPVVKNNKLVYSSAKIEADRNEYNVVIKYSYVDNAKTKHYYYIGYHAPAQKYSPSCFTPDTLVTLVDGTQKRVDALSFDDRILAWDFFTGTYVEQNISLLVNHGEGIYEVANLEFSDGTVLRLIADHGVFDYDLNKFVYITVDNMESYIGHRFVQYNADGSYNIVTLTDAFETEEYTSAWSITSAGTSNAFASGLLTVAPPEDFYNWIEMDGKLHYDVEQFQKDVETYGLYTYDVFADYVTYEQFVDWNGAYLKIAVEKGYFTFEYILELIELYKGWMPQ